MLALIMAGGFGSRLNMGEKPMVTICGRPMIDYIIQSFQDFGATVAVIGSHRTPYTQNWCRARCIDYFRASGTGYVEDIIEAVEFMDENRPLFTSVADIPLLKSRTIEYIHHHYQLSGKDACSTWIPHDLVKGQHCRTTYLEKVDGVNACPIGINILRGDIISETQDEFRLLLSEPGLAFNVNTRDELAVVQEHVCGNSKNSK